MNVYDQAHQLATAIKESEECKQYNAVRKKLEENPAAPQYIRTRRGVGYFFSAERYSNSHND